MASDGPDPQSLGSWEDVFQYPIPTVRRVEQELRRDIASNKEKLRALVGTRYRELVGTAETIVCMNREMEEVDSNLGDVGRRCNPRLMGRQHVHFRQMNSGANEQSATKRALGAQLALLHRLSVSISRLLRSRGSPLLIAKLLVISRLLHKTLLEQMSVPPFLETLRNQLTLLRRALRSRIDKRLASTNSTVDEIIEALSAYCLATSSSSDDAIAYFHKIRFEAIGNQLDLAGAPEDNILAALRLYVRTLQVSKTLLSRRFLDALGRLKLRPLLADPDISGVNGLDLDVLGRWVAADITNFTPWIKLSDLSKQDAGKTIKKWSKTAFESFTDHSGGYLANWTDFSKLLLIRKETMQLWLSSWSSTPSHSAFQVLEGIRTVFNKRLAELLSDYAQTLEGFGDGVEFMIANWGSTAHEGSQSPWDYELVTLDYSNGAAALKECIANRLFGLDDNTSEALEKYKAWLLSIRNLRQAIDGLRQMRWPDIIDEAADEDLDVDISAILNEDDTQLLWEALEAAVQEAFNSLQISFDAIFKTIGDTNKINKAAFMLKIVRLVRRDLPREFISNDMRFSQDIVPQLQEMIAKEVAAHTRPLSLVTLINTRPQTLPGRTLWEGEPELPVQPSPSTFKFLRRTVGVMDQYGPGLWDGSTVHALKTTLQAQLAETIVSCLTELDCHFAEFPESDAKIASPLQNGDVTPLDGLPEIQGVRDRKLQLYFDTVYLGLALADKNIKQAPLLEVTGKLRVSLGADAEKTTKTVDQKAQEYWHRTRLVFGLLATDLE